jgi:cobalt-zinc-cadmium efflux system protein
LSTSQTALTAHLVLSEAANGAALLERACTDAQAKFGIGHCTFQLETMAAAQSCALRPHEVV